MNTISKPSTFIMTLILSFCFTLHGVGDVIETPATIFDEHDCWAMDISPDATIVAIGDHELIQVYDIQTTELLFTFDQHTERVHSVAFSPDASMILSGAEDNNAYLWNSRTGEIIRELPQTGIVVHVAFSPDGEHFLIGGIGGYYALWHINQDEPLVQKTYIPNVLSVAFNSDGTDYAIGLGNATVEQYSIDSRRYQWSERYLGSVQEVAFSPDGSQLAIGTDGKFTKILSSANGHEIQTLEGFTNSVTGIEYSPDGSLILTADWDGTVYLWDTTTWEIVREFVGNGDVHVVAFSPDSQFFMTGEIKGNAKLWDVSDLLAKTPLNLNPIDKTIINDFMLY